jgi:glycoprotein endo-alpha-1,2-mannosidase
MSSFEQQCMPEGAWCGADADADEAVELKSDPHTDPYKIVGIRAYRMDMTGAIECPPSWSQPKDEIATRTGDDNEKGFTAWRNPKLDESAETTPLSEEEEESEDGWSRTGGFPRVCCLRTGLICLIFAVIFGAGLGAGMRVKAKNEASAPRTANGLTLSDGTGGDIFLSSSPSPAPQEVPIGEQDILTPTPTVLASTTAPTVELLATDPPEPIVPTPVPTNPDPTALPTAAPTGSWETPPPEGMILRSKALVGVYYYPWHGSNFHNGDGYIRSQLDPPQSPVLGEYDDSKAEVVKQHLAWSRQANVGLLVTSWWGPNSSTDSTTKDVILKHEDLGDMKIALHYETSGRIQLGEDGQYSMENVGPDIQHMCDNYFDHPNYFQIDGRPVVVLYVSRVLDGRGILEQAVTSMRDAASACGHNVYIVGDQAFWDAPETSEVYNAFFLLDAITNYDMYGTTMRGRQRYYAGTGLVEDHFTEQEDWRTEAHAHGCRFVPAVSPGFNDRGVRLERNHLAMSRKLSQDADPGTLFQYALEKALPLIDPQVQDLLLINSFNEWHEDTQIEPVGVSQTTSLPDELTNGVEYEGYGELYLNILREATTELVSNVFSNGV